MARRSSPTGHYLHVSQPTVLCCAFYFFQDNLPDLVLELIIPINPQCQRVLWFFQNNLGGGLEQEMIRHNHHHNTTDEVFSSTVNPKRLPLLCPAPNRWGIKLCFCLTSVAYIGPKSRTARPRKTKIGTEVDHVTHDLDNTFRVKGQGHQAALVGSSMFIDKTSLCATAESEALPGNHEYS